jgi:hypothetical protein
MVAVMASAPARGDEIYHWVDDQGVANFSQISPPDKTEDVSKIIIDYSEMAASDLSEEVVPDYFFMKRTFERTRAEWDRIGKRRQANRELRIAAMQNQARYQPQSQPEPYHGWPVWYRKQGHRRGIGGNGQRSPGMGGGKAQPEAVSFHPDRRN